MPSTTCGGDYLDRFMLLGTQIGDHALFPVYLTLIVLAATFAVTRATGDVPNQGQKLALSWLGTLSILCVAYLLDSAFLTWAKHWFDFPIVYGGAWVNVSKINYLGNNSTRMAE